MKRLKLWAAAIARFLRLSDPKGCAYGAPRCPGGRLCRHDRDEIRHDPSDVPVDEQLHRYGYAVTERTMSARELQARRAREGKSYINERGQLVEPLTLTLTPDSPDLSKGLGQPLPRYSVPWPDSYQPTGGYVHDSSPIDPLNRPDTGHVFTYVEANRPVVGVDVMREGFVYSDGWFEPTDIRQARDAYAPDALIGKLAGGAPLTAGAAGAGSYALHNVVDRESEPQVSLAYGFEGSCEACGRLIVVDELIHHYADDVVVHASCPVPRAST